jgi:glycosyltransferase involved in cell wall biosynthesis
MTAAARAITDDYEPIFVNDGSPDDSQDVAEKLLAGDRHRRSTFTRFRQQYGRVVADHGFVYGL